MSALEKNHYEVLGVDKRASKNDIRNAYRQCAREAHPDTAPSSAPDYTTGFGAGSITNASARMAEISLAWAVLSDPERRRRFDAESVITSEPDTSEPETSEPETRREAGHFVERSKFPWRFMLVLLFAGIIAVLVLDAMSQPAIPAGPDGLLSSGSCIVIDANLTAVEVRCEDSHDGVVRQLVGFDMTCPSDTEAIRDRQGMGLACVVRS